MYQFPMYYPKGFEPSRAHELAYLCKQAYGLFEIDPPPARYELERYKGERYEDVTPFWGGYKLTSPLELLIVVAAALKMHHKVNLHEMFGFVARRGDDVFVVFRGTDSVLDFLGDIHMSQVPIGRDHRPDSTGSWHWDAARLEQGVWNMYSSMREQIMNAIQALQKPGRRLFVTGHSLGAGLAIAAVPDLLKNAGYKTTELYTFAGPRVANREFALALLDHRVPCYRVVHTEDVVPTLPFPTPITIFDKVWKGRWYYSHVGTPVDFCRAWAPTDTPDVKANHTIDLYLAALDQTPAAQLL